MRTITAVVALLLSTVASATPPHFSDETLVDQHGMTLYVFGGKEAPDTKSCEGDCKKNFPPAVGDEGDTGAGNLTLVPLPTGERQWAYKGKLLYHGAMDKKPGDTHGDGLNTVWHAARP